MLIGIFLIIASNQSELSLGCFSTKKNCKFMKLYYEQIICKHMQEKSGHQQVQVQNSLGNYLLFV